MDIARTIKRVDPWSMARVTAITYALMGLIINVLTALSGNKTAAYSVGYIIGGTLTLAIIGLIGGWLGAIFYNFAAKKVGGVKIELE